MSTQATAGEPTLIGMPPPNVRRDRIVYAWVGGATVSSFGDAVFAIAVAWTAVHLLSPAMAGLVVGIGTLPQAALTLAGGVIADRFDTRRVVLLGEISRGLVLLIAALLWQSGMHTSSLLLAVALAFGIAAGLSNPARATLARQLVRTEDLVAVGGWMQIGGRSARLAGAPVGALVVAAGGLGPSMLVDAATFAVIAAALSAVIRPRYVVVRPAQAWRPALVDGIRYLRRSPLARWLTLGISSLNVFISPVIGIGVALRVAQSGWAASWVGVAEASLAIGAITGSFLALRWRPEHLAARAFWTLVVQGTAIALIGVPTEPTLIAAMFVVGLTAGMASVWLSGIFQQTIAPSHLGRVSAVSQLGDQTLTPLMLPLFGFTVAATNLDTATLAFGLAMAALCLFFAMRPTICNL